MVFSDDEASTGLAKGIIATVDGVGKPSKFTRKQAEESGSSVGTSKDHTDGDFEESTAGSYETDNDFEG